MVFLQFSKNRGEASKGLRPEMENCNFQLFFFFSENGRRKMFKVVPSIRRRVSWQKAKADRPEINQDLLMPREGGRRWRSCQLCDGLRAAVAAGEGCEGRPGEGIPAHTRRAMGGLSALVDIAAFVAMEALSLYPAVSLLIIIGL